MDFFENTGGAQATLSWAGPGVSATIVPQASLRPYFCHGLISQFYTNGTWSTQGGSLVAGIATPNLVRVDGPIDSNWNESSPDTNYISTNDFCAWYRGKVLIPGTPGTSGTYKFWGYADDHIDIYVNGTALMVNNPWANLGVGSITLTAGVKYYIDVRSSENGGGALTYVYYSGPGIGDGSDSARTIIPLTNLFAVLNEAPSNISISNSTIGNIPSGSLVGNLTTTDIDNSTGAGSSFTGQVPTQTFTYALVGGAGSTNNASFSISGGQLLTGVANLNAGTYSVRIRTTDSGEQPNNLYFEKAFTITVNDTTAPVPGTCTPPAYAKENPIEVPYSDASDSGGSGLKKVELWYKKGSSGTWLNSNLTQTGATGSFNFTGGTTADTYYFDLVAEDNAGNRSSVASGTGDGSTSYDPIPPTAVCKNITFTLPGTFTVTASDIDGGSSDNVGITTRTINGGTSQQYTSANVGENSATLLVGDAAGNTHTCTATVTIAKATPAATLSVTNSPVTYNGTARAATVGITSSSVPGAVANVLTGGSFTQTNAGTYAVTADFVPTDSANYSTLYGLSAGDFVINKANQVITFPDLSPKTYGEGSFDPGAASNSGLAVSYASSNPAVATGGSVVTIVGAGSTIITASQSGNVNYNPAANVNKGLTVNPKSLAVSITGNPTKYFDETTAATLAPGDYTVNGRVGTDTITVTKTSGTYASAAVGVWNVQVALSPGDFAAGPGTLLTNYSFPNSAEGNGTISAKLVPTVTTWPTAHGPITYGQALNATYLNTDGVASVPGTFGFTNPTTQPGSAGTYTAGVTFTPSDTVTYEKVTGTVPVTVNKATATVTLGDLNQTYTGAPRSATATTSPGGLTVNLTYDGSATAPTAAGAYSVTGTINDTNYQGSASGTLNVAKITLSVLGATVTPKTYDGTPAATITGAVLSSGVVSGDEVVLANHTSGTFAQVDVGTGITVNTLPMTLTGDDAGNYALTQPALTGTITAKGLTVENAVAQSKTYDGTLAATITGAVLSSGVVSGDDVSLANHTSGTFAQAGVGTGIAVNTLPMTLTGDDADNYTLTAQPVLSADINPKGLTVENAVAQSKTYDGTLAAVISGAVLSTGVVGGDEVVLANHTSGTFAQAGVGTGITVNTLPMTLAGEDAGNYVLTAQPVLSADITAKELTADIINNPTKRQDGNTAATLKPVHYRLNGLAAGESIVVTETSGTYASADLGTWTVMVILEAGDFTAGPGTSLTNYSLPTSATGPGTIADKLVPEVTAWPTASAITYGQALSASGLTGGSAVDPVEGTEVAGTFAFTDSGITPSSAGTYDASVTFTPMDGESYTTTSGNVPVTVHKALATVTLGSLSQTYTKTQKSATATTSPEGLTVEFVYDPAPPINAGGYAVTATVNDTNYQGTASGTLTIAPAALTVEADAKTKVYGTADPAFTYSTTPSTLYGDDTLSGALTRVAGESAGTYAIEQGTVTAGANYAITYLGADLTITKAAATVTLNGLNQTYDGAAKPITATTAPAGLTVVFSYNGVPDAPVLAGSYPVTGTIDDTNYQGSASGTLVIAKATPVITTPPSATAITYGERLSASSLSGGEATLGGAPVAGGFAFTDDTIKPNASPAYAASVTFTPLDGDNFTTGVGTASVLVNKKPLTIAIVNNPTKYVDGNPNAPLRSDNYRLEGLVGSESITVLKTSGLYDSAEVGSRTVTVTLTDGDYTGGPGTLVSNYVLPALATGPGTITDKLIPEVSWPTASAITYGQPLSASVLSGGSAQYGGAPVEGSFAFTNGGLIPNANPSYTASVTFTPASEAYVSLSRDVTVTVHKAEATVTLGNLTPVYTKTQKSATAVTTPPGLAVIIVYGSSTRINAGEYTLTATVEDDNYQGSASGTLVIAPAPLTVTAEAKTKMLGEADPPLTYTITPSSLYSGDTMEGALARVPGEAAGVYAILQNTLTAGPNYAITYVGANLEITVFSVVYNGPNPVVARVKDRVEITVEAKHYTGSVSYHWYKVEGKGLTPVPNGDEATLVFDPVAPEHAGVYLCEASWSGGTAQSEEIELQVLSGMPAGGLAALVLLVIGLGASGVGLSKRRKS